MAVVAGCAARGAAGTCCRAFSPRGQMDSKSYELATSAAVVSCAACTASVATKCSRVSCRSGHGWEVDAGPTPEDSGPAAAVAEAERAAASPPRRLATVGLAAARAESPVAAVAAVLLLRSGSVDGVEPMRMARACRAATDAAARLAAGTGAREHLQRPDRPLGEPTYHCPIYTH
jgi:hypothetical protein